MKIAIILNYSLQEQIDVGHLDVLMVMFRNLLKKFDEVHVFSMGDAPGKKYDLGRGDVGNGKIEHSKDARAIAQSAADAAELCAIGRIQQRDSIFVHTLPGKELLGMLSNAMLFRKFAGKENFSAIRVLATTKSAFVAIIGTLGMGVPIVISVHVHRQLYQEQSGLKLNPLLEFLTSQWERFALSRARLVPVISRYIMDYVKGMGVPEERIILHRNFVDVGVFSPEQGKSARPRMQPHSGKPRVTIGFVGRLVGAKGCDILVKSMPELVTRFRGAEIMARVAGDGPELPALQELAKRLKVQEHVEFMGAVRHEELPEMLGSCDIYAAPLQAGFVLNEAMACGLPVVAADIEWSSEIIDEKVGMLVPAGDVRNFIFGLGELVRLRLEEPEKFAELSRNARKRAVEELGREAYEKRELEIYGKVLGR